MLGNQLFQFAFGIGASLRLGTSFVMADDKLRDLFTLGEYGHSLDRVRRSLGYRMQRAVHPFPVVKIGNTDFASPEDVLDRLEDRRNYAGFFQSEGFFRDAASRVRAAFTPLPRHRARFESRYSELTANGYVCCHVRRTDYLKWRGGVALPSAYYADALDALAAGDLPVVFVGDDLTEVERTFGHRRGVRFEHGDEIVDFLLLVNAHAVVTSNSSFGWWGAWLGRPERTVVAPRHWAGFKDGREYPPAVIPSRWTQIPVREDA